MSVVARQSFKYSIIGYLGFLLGTVSAIFIFPFDMVFYGKLRFVLSATLMLVPFVVFGLSYSNVYFFGKAKEEGKHQNLFSLSLVGVGINFFIFLLGFFAFFYIFSSFQEDSELWDMKRLILPMVLVMSLSAVFNRYISNFKRILTSKRLNHHWLPRLLIQPYQRAHIPIVSIGTHNGPIHVRRIIIDSPVFVDILLLNLVILIPNGRCHRSNGCPKKRMRTPP